MNPNIWIDEFLHRRELDHPDGRALYAYRCTAEEFGSLAETLSHSDPYGSRVSTGRFGHLSFMLRNGGSANTTAAIGHGNRC